MTGRAAQPLQPRLRADRLNNGPFRFCSS